jgi:hypothetical protein
MTNEKDTPMDNEEDLAAAEAAQESERQQAEASLQARLDAGEN